MISFSDNNNKFFSNQVPSMEPKPNLETLFKQYSSLSSENFALIATSIIQNGTTWVSEARKKHAGIHICKKDSGLPIAININERGDLFLQIGKVIGQGQFRVSELSCGLMKGQCVLTVKSKQKIKDQTQAKWTETENRILEKLAFLMEEHVNVEGILKYYTSFKYEKRKLSSLNESCESEKKVCNGSYLDEGSSHEVSSDELSSYVDKIEFQQEKQKLSAERRHLTFTHYCNGGNLESRLKSLDYQEKKLIAKKILTGLAWLHSKKFNIFHSDLKPDNIFLEVDNKGRVVNAVIGDYGFACNLNDPIDRFYKKGHTNFKAPEVKALREGHAINENVLAGDVFSMGLILLEMFDENDSIFPLLQTMVAESPKKRPTAQKALEEFLTNTYSKPDASA